MFSVAVLLLAAMFQGWIAYWIGVLWLLVYITLFIIGIFHIRWAFFLPVWSKGDTQGKQHIAITFDDGPSGYTKSVLEILAQYDARATFFCIGKEIERFPEVCRLIVDKGHIIGNHTYFHHKHFPFQKAETTLPELDKTNTLIHAITGKRTKLFRPPYGVTHPGITRILKKTNFYTIGWNIRSLDTVIRDEERIYRRIIRRIQPGAVILLHDTSQRTVGVLKKLLAYLKQQKIKVVPLDQLLKIDVYEK